MEEQSSWLDPVPMASLIEDALKHSTRYRHPDVPVCPQVPSLFPRVPACTAARTLQRKLSRGDIEPSSREVPAYPLCVLPAMTPAHSAATRPPPPPLPSPGATCKRCARRGRERECGVGWEPALQSRAARRRRQGALSNPVVRWRARGAARTLRQVRGSKAGVGFWGLYKREVRVGSEAWGLRVPKTWSEARVAASPAG